MHPHFPPKFGVGEGGSYSPKNTVNKHVTHSPEFMGIIYDALQSPSI